VFDPSLPREPASEAARFGRQLPSWLAERFAEALECALDPDCEAQQCEEGVDGHPRVREVSVVLGEDKHYLCAVHLAQALERGLIQPGACVRCGRAEGVNMGHLLALGAAFTIWFRVCDRCRPTVSEELGVPA
jgi:hypothetical protein